MAEDILTFRKEKETYSVAIRLSYHTVEKLIQWRDSLRKVMCVFHLRGI